MGNYTLEQLRNDGPPIAMAMLIDCIEHGEPFITYGRIREALEKQLGIERIFSPQIGQVAGSLMDQIMELDSKAPLINVLITRGSGIPGNGAGPYLAARYNDPSLSNWEKVSKERKLSIVARERAKVFKYNTWGEIHRQLFGTRTPNRANTTSAGEVDFPETGHGGPAESVEHRRLKEWVAKHPRSIGISRSFGVGETEYCLLSGDTVDVMFANEGEFRAVEAKSIRSGDEDIRRGLYQCVKYKAVKEAEISPYEPNVEVILVTERKLPAELKERSRELGIRCKCVVVNRGSGNASST